MSTIIHFAFVAMIYKPNNLTSGSNVLIKYTLKAVSCLYEHTRGDSNSIDISADILIYTE